MMMTCFLSLMENKRKKGKARSEQDGKSVLTLSTSSLNALPKETLLEHLEDLSAYTRVLEKKLKMPVTEPGMLPQMDVPTDQDDSELVKALQTTIVKGLKRQMVWKPSCKNGTVGCVFEGFSQPTVFQKALGLADLKKKVYKIVLKDFYEALDVCDITADIRYGYLVIMCEHVNVHWNATLNQFKISAKYGKQ